MPLLASCVSLTYLDLSWNSLGGAIPTEMGRINNIQIVNLGFKGLVLDAFAEAPGFELGK